MRWPRSAAQTFALSLVPRVCYSTRPPCELVDLLCSSLLRLGRLRRRLVRNALVAVNAGHPAPLERPVGQPSRLRLLLGEHGVSVVAMAAIFGIGFLELIPDPVRHPPALFFVLFGSGNNAA